MSQYSDNKSRYLRYNRSEKGRATAAKNARAVRRRLRQAVILLYGGFCDCCGESTLEFLTIDHRNGRTGEHKNDSTGTPFYRQLIHKASQGVIYPTLRVLCYNCNCAIGCYGYCPHDGGGN